MTMGMESNTNSCFNDVCDKPIDHLLSLIKEYQDKPLVYSQTLKTFIDV
jgi:hypothetical protein